MKCLPVPGTGVFQTPEQAKLSQDWGPWPRSEALQDLTRAQVYGSGGKRD